MIDIIIISIIVIPLMGVIIYGIKRFKNSVDTLRFLKNDEYMTFTYRQFNIRHNPKQFFLIITEYVQLSSLIYLKGQIIPVNNDTSFAIIGMPTLTLPDDYVEDIFWIIISIIVILLIIIFSASIFDERDHDICFNGYYYTSNQSVLFTKPNCFNKFIGKIRYVFMLIKISLADYSSSFIIPIISYLLLFSKKLTFWHDIKIMYVITISIIYIIICCEFIYFCYLRSHRFTLSYFNEYTFVVKAITTILNYYFDTLNSLILNLVVCGILLTYVIIWKPYDYVPLNYFHMGALISALYISVISISVYTYYLNMLLIIMLICGNILIVIVTIKFKNNKMKELNNKTRHMSKSNEFKLVSDMVPSIFEYVYKAYLGHYKKKPQISLNYDNMFISMSEHLIE